MAVEDGFLDVRVLTDEVVEIDEVPVVAGTVERLVERGEALLPVEDQLEWCGGERRGVLHLTRLEGVRLERHEQEAAGWKVLRDRLDELLSLARLPDEVALEIWKRKFTLMNARQQVLERLRVNFERLHRGQ